MRNDNNYDSNIRKACARSGYEHNFSAGLGGGRNWTDRIDERIDNPNKHRGDMQADAVRILRSM